MRTWTSLAFALLALSPALRAQDAPAPNDGVDATLWIQQSAEYRACALQAYHLATAQLRPALEDKAWTASLEQRTQGNFGALPPAVILDADETSLDNSDFQALLIKTGGVFTPDLWLAWVNSAQARAVPGAVEFCQAARAAGVAVFWISNRKVAEVDGTTRNLQKLGFPVTEGCVLPRVDTKDKGPRRAQLAQRYRILLLLGDNGADFASGYDEGGNDQRLTLAADHADLWGTKWVIIPNPTYGRWLDVVIGSARTAADRETAKSGALRVPTAPVVVAPKPPSLEARIERVKADMSSIKNALNLFKVDTGRYPQQLSELWERPANATKWGPDPYLTSTPPKDPWGNEYGYQYAGGRDLEIVSYGADGAPGGVGDAADLSSKTINR